MHHLLAANELFERPSHERLEGPALLVPLGKGRWRADLRHGPESIVLVLEHPAELGLADAYSVFQHGLEYRLQLAGRA